MVKRQDIIMHNWNHIVKMTMIFVVFLFLMLAMQGCVNPGIDTEYSEYPGPSLQIRKELYLDNYEKSIELNCWIELSSLHKEYCIA